MDAQTGKSMHTGARTHTHGETLERRPPTMLDGNA